MKKRKGLLVWFQERRRALLTLQGDYIHLSFHTSDARDKEGVAIQEILVRFAGTNGMNYLKLGDYFQDIQFPTQDELIMFEIETGHDIGRMYKAEVTTTYVDITNLEVTTKSMHRSWLGYDGGT